MRTVHETEALRPSDPVPKHHSSNPQNKAQRIKLTLKGLAPAVNNGDSASNKDPLSAIKSNASNPVSPSMPPTASPAETEYEHNNVTFIPKTGGGTSDTWDLRFPSDINFSPEELDLSPPDLFRLLRHRLQWSMKEGDELRAETNSLEEQRKQEWDAKELILENYMEGEMVFAEKKRLTGRKAKSYEEEDVRLKMRADVGPSKKLEISHGGKPSWREKPRLQAEGLPALPSGNGDITMSGHNAS